MKIKKYQDYHLSRFYPNPYTDTNVSLLAQNLRK